MKQKIEEVLTSIGAMTREQVDEVFKMQKQGGDRRFTDIAVEKGYLQDNALKRYIDYLEKGTQEANRITLAIDRERDLSILSVTGAPSATEIMDVLFSVYLGMPTRFFLWDLREAGMSKLSLCAIKALVRTAGELAAGTRRGEKSAFLLGSRLQIGLLRLTTLMAEINNNPVRYRMFQTMADAMRWFEERTSETSAEANESEDLEKGSG